MNLFYKAAQASKHIGCFYRKNQIYLEWETGQIWSKEEDGMTDKNNVNDHLLNSPELLTTTEVAKYYKISASELNKLLYDFRVQFNNGGHWMLLAKYTNRGYLDEGTSTYTDKYGSIGNSYTNRWTLKGRHFIYKLLKENGILPIAEKQ